MLTSSLSYNGNQASFSNKNIPETKFFGKGQVELATLLSQTWWKDGTPICIVQGFSGVGKTFLARTLMKNVDSPSVMVTIPNNESDQTDELLLDLATELSLIGINEMAYAVENGSLLSSALERVLRKKILIIVDEFQQVLDGSGKTFSELGSILDRIANRPHFPGRILLLSNRLIERSKWSEAYTIVTLSALEPEEAEQLLDIRLREAHRSQEIPLERRRDVVNWLGCNPRAIQVLVGALELDSLDDLIGLSPKSWELRERDVSPELLNRLEHELLERTLNHLKAETNKIVQRLSVYRKPVKRKAIEMFLPTGVEFTSIRDDLISRFLMEQHSGWFTLNSIVKEISLLRLKRNQADLQRAHSKAADYYTRHFKAKNIIGGGQLSGYFVESRYHLVQAKRDKDLTGIAELFGNHLREYYKHDYSIPDELDELDERIAILSTLLDKTSDRGLEYYLARLYKARGTYSDIEKSLIYATRATGLGAVTSSWMLRIQLEKQLNGSEQALNVYREAINRINVEPNLLPFYLGCGELLAQMDKLEEAVALLKEGIARIPDAQVVDVYLKCGELLAQMGQSEEAVALFKEGIARVPVAQAVDRLYLKCGELLAQMGQSEATVSLFKEGIARVPVAQAAMLYLKCGELLAQMGQSEEAVSLLKEGITYVPVDRAVVTLYLKCGELLAQMGQSEEAVALFKEGIVRVPVAQALDGLYLKCGELLAQIGQSEEAVALFKEGIARVPVDKSLFILYLGLQRLLTQMGRSEEAISLLKEGIARIPVDQAVVALYRNGGELLTQMGRSEEAISLLKEGIARIPAAQGTVTLYLKCGELLMQMGRVEEAISLLKNGIERTSANANTSELKSLLQSL